jgi:hypothetical protein
MVQPTALRRIYLAVAVCVIVSACGNDEPLIEGPGAEVRELTGAHTRVVWGQQDGSDPRLLGDQVTLMAFDSDDGRGERPVLTKLGSYVKPMLTPDGARIVYSTRPKPGPAEVFIVNWDGSGHEKIADGIAMTFWTDPAEGQVWLYLATDTDGFDTSHVVRFPLDAPDQREPVWTKSKISAEGFKVSPDGRYASAAVPWPKVGVIELPNGEITVLGNGCWPSLTDARGPLCWYFDGAHRNVTMVDVDTQTRWMVNVNGVPGFNGAEVFHPRWTNHSRVLVMSGPYDQGGSNQARTGGPQVEIYLGRFAADYSEVEAWARVTTNNLGDSHPDAWIDVEQSSVPQRPSGPLGPEHVRGPGDDEPKAEGGAEQVVLTAQLTKPGPVPTPEEILPYRHALVVNEYKVVDVISGAFEDETIQVAQWAIRDSRVLPDARRVAGTGSTLAVERYDAHPELEGERLISDSNSTQPLYYDVSAGQ